MKEYNQMAVSWSEFNENYSFNDSSSLLIPKNQESSPSNRYKVLSYEPEGLILEKISEDSRLEDLVSDSKMIS